MDKRGHTAIDVAISGGNERFWEIFFGNWVNRVISSDDDNISG